MSRLHRRCSFLGGLVAVLGVALAIDGCLRDTIFGGQKLRRPSTTFMLDGSHMEAQRMVGWHVGAPDARWRTSLRARKWKFSAGVDTKVPVMAPIESLTEEEIAAVVGGMDDDEEEIEERVVKTKSRVDPGQAKKVAQSNSGSRRGGVDARQVPVMAPIESLTEEEIAAVVGGMDDDEEEIEEMVVKTKSRVDPGQAKKVSTALVLANGTNGTNLTLKTLKKGQKLNGTVTKVIRKGIFVDVGVGKDGFMHISKCADGRRISGGWEITDEVAEAGENMTVWVIKVKEDGEKFELSARPPVELESYTDVKPDQWLQAWVTAIDWSGFYVKVQGPGGGEPQQGKVRRTDIRKGHVKNPLFEADIGDRVRVRVKSVDVKNGWLDVTMRDMSKE